MTSVPPPDAPPQPRRERYRAQTVADIKDAARRRIAEGGAGALSLNALAKSLGMAGPSLYRYFASRDALLTELVADAFTELADALDDAAAGEPDGERQLRAYAAAYRSWGLERRELWELLYGTPVPGFVPSLEQTGDAAGRSLAALAGIIARVRAESGTTTEAAPQLRPDERWSAKLTAEPRIDRTAFVLAVRAWARVHGLLSLELHGHTPEIVADPAALYAAEVDDIVTAARS